MNLVVWRSEKEPYTDGMIARVNGEGEPWK
jgi:hypothetical protein